MGIREDVLALVEELDGVSFKENCDQCLACGTALCRGDMECAESVHKACAKRLREIVEHDACEVTTVSAYDLLGDEDREALAWVRDHGGLEEVKASIHQGAMEHGCLLKVAEMLGTSIYDGTDNADALLDKLEKRLMPAGCEWPRFEDGELVEFGDVVGLQSGAWMEHHVDEIMFNDDGSVEVFGDGNCISFERGETARRIVLAADGEPLEVGQTVWHVGNGVEFTVIGLPNPGEYQAVKLRLDDGAFTGLDPDQLTHQRPVLDADGVPIKEGDTLWRVNGDGPFTAIEYKKAWMRVKSEDGHVVGYWPDDLTHAKPDLDTWERIESDVMADAKDYCESRGISPEYPKHSGKAKCEDLVRCCRALAERGEL